MSEQPKPPAARRVGVRRNKKRFWKDHTMRAKVLIEFEFDPISGDERLAFIRAEEVQKLALLNAQGVAETIENKCQTITAGELSIPYWVEKLPVKSRIVQCRVETVLGGGDPGGARDHESVSEPGHDQPAQHAPDQDQPDPHFEDGTVVGIGIFREDEDCDRRGRKDAPGGEQDE
jgi:hypothetical protein